MTGLPQLGQGSPSWAFVDVGDDVGREVAADVDVPVVEALAVGARDEVRGRGDELVDDDGRVVRADRRAVAGLHAGAP